MKCKFELQLLKAHTKYKGVYFLLVGIKQVRWQHRGKVKLHIAGVHFT